MNIAPFTSLFNEVLAELPGVPQPLAVNAIRNSAIDFCEQSKVWVVDVDPMSSISNQANYEYEPDAGADVIGISQAWYNGVEILPRTSAQLQTELSSYGVPWAKVSGIPSFYNSERADEFILAPYPIEAMESAIEMKVILRPSRTSIGMEKWILDKYFQHIAAGAKARLCAMPGKPWSSPDLVNFNINIFNVGTTGASLASSHTQVLPQITVSPSPI